MKRCLILLLAVPLFGQNPDLTGVWKRVEAGSSATWTIEQEGPAVKLTQESKFSGGRLSGGLWGSRSYTADGVERAGKNDWTTASWEGAALVILRVVKDGYRVTVTRESWSVSADGRTLTRSRRTIDMDGVRESAETLEKQ